jgi:hypothetical protein
MERHIRAAISDERALAIAREELPDCDDDARMWAVWNETGFPCFFVRDAEAELRAQLKRYRETALRHVPAS